MRPYMGILVWSWLGYMNPHRLSWSFAYDMPFAQIVALTTLIGFIFTTEKRRIPLNSTTAIWAFFIVWITVTTIFAIDTELSYPGWEKAIKIQLFSFLTLALIHGKNKLHALLWVIVISLGFFGLKGGIFVLLSGGGARVYGPPGSFIADNNAMALALIMTVPLMWYLVSTLTNRWLRLGVIGVTGSTILAILGSHSRGAVLAGGAMVLLLLTKTQRKFLAAAVVFAMIAVGLATMPKEWFDRMDTIRTYEEDNSAMGRLTAWQFAAEMASQRPIGGGFEAFVESNYQTYSPEISQQIEARDGRYQGAHSIYFRVLGEHGFLGLALFLALGFSAYRRAGRIQRMAIDDDELAWVRDLGSALQVSIVGYAVGGAFLGLSYFDLFYHLICMILILDQLVRSRLEEMEATRDAAPSDKL